MLPYYGYQEQPCSKSEGVKSIKLVSRTSAQCAAVMMCVRVQLKQQVQLRSVWFVLLKRAFESMDVYDFWNEIVI